MSMKFRGSIDSVQKQQTMAKQLTNNSNNNNNNNGTKLIHEKHTAERHVEKPVQDSENPNSWVISEKRTQADNYTKQLKEKSTGRKHKTREKIADNVTKIAKPFKQVGMCLPWWFVYVAWLLAFLIVTISSFFTILYSFNYGLEVSIQWLSSLGMSFITDVFFGQPVAIIMLSFILTIFLRRSIETKVFINVDFMGPKRKRTKLFSTPF